MSVPAVQPSEDRHVPETFEGQPLEPNFYCRAWNPKREKYCKRRAGSGTDHTGVGRCRHHGGMSRAKHGLYARYDVPERIGKLAENLRADEAPFDVREDLVQMRALYADYLQRAEAGEVELDHEAASRILDRVSKIIDRVERARSDSYITRPQFYRLMGEMGNVVAQAVTSDDERRRIVEGWAQIRLA